MRSDPNITPSAVVLLSGGLDSTTCLAIAQSSGFTCHALSFYYGQRHAIECETAQRIAIQMQVASHQRIDLPTFPFKSSLLTNADQKLPDFQTTTGIAPTYVPARNTLFLSFALAYAETLQASAIFIGVSAVDYSGYPDCRPAFIDAFQHVIDVGTRAGLSENGICLQAPLLHLSKAETLQLGTRLGVDYALTVSCYQANAQGEACGHCESCGLRRKGFKEAGLPDVTRYAGVSL